MLTVFIKVAVIFSMVGLGFIANKADILPDESNPYLVNLLLVVTSPCLILDMLVSRTLTPDLINDTIIIFVGTFGFYGFACLAAWLLMKPLCYEPKRDRGVLMGTVSGINQGFMGFPITLSIFGEDAFFLLVIANIVGIVYLYLIYILQLRSGSDEPGRKRSLLKSMINMCTIASIIGLILFLFQIKLPEPVMDFLGTIGDATIPLSMIVVGVQLGRADFREMLKNYKLIICCLANVALIPGVFFLIVNPLPLSDLVKTVLVFQAAMPAPVAQVAIASWEKKNATLAAEGVALTTLFSMATLPLFAILLMHVYTI